MHLEYNPNNYCYKSGALTLRFAQYANKKKNGAIKFDPGGQPDERAIKIKRNRIHPWKQNITDLKFNLKL